MSRLGEVARQRTFGDVTTSVAAAGTTQGTGTALTADHCDVTSATQGSAEAVTLREGNQLDLRTVTNKTAITIFVYPPTGASINGVTANLPLSLPPKRAGWFLFTSSLTISCVTTA